MERVELGGGRGCIATTSRRRHSNPANCSSNHSYLYIHCTPTRRLLGYQRGAGNCAGREGGGGAEGSGHRKREHSNNVRCVTLTK